MNNYIEGVDLITSFRIDFCIKFKRVHPGP